MKILVVDDHALVREGLCQVLKGLDDLVEVLEAPDCTSAFELARLFLFSHKQRLCGFDCEVHPCGLGPGVKVSSFGQLLAQTVPGGLPRIGEAGPASCHVDFVCHKSPLGWGWRLDYIKRKPRLTLLKPQGAWGRFGNQLGTSSLKLGTPPPPFFSAFFRYETGSQNWFPLKGKGLGTSFLH